MGQQHTPSASVLTSLSNFKTHCGQLVKSLSIYFLEYSFKDILVHYSYIDDDWLGIDQPGRVAWVEGVWYWKTRNPRWYQNTRSLKLLHEYKTTVWSWVFKVSRLDYSFFNLKVCLKLKDKAKSHSVPVQSGVNRGKWYPPSLCWGVFSFARHTPRVKQKNWEESWRWGRVGGWASSL